MTLLLPKFVDIRGGFHSSHAHRAAIIVAAIIHAAGLVAAVPALLSNKTIFLHKAVGGVISFSVTVKVQLESMTVAIVGR